MNNSTAVFIYDGKEILSETTTEGTKTNIFGNNMIATTGTDTLYYQYNNHGDVVRVLDQSGTLKNEYDYDAFGNAITEKETVKNPYRYAGYYQDTESGLYYLRSRYYNPKTARFLTEDTASGKYTDPLSLNKYTYCHNQPVTGYDPDGHALHIFAGAVVGGLIGGAMSYASQAWKNKSFTKGIDWKQVAGGAAEGAITGAIGAATGGASVFATAAKSGLKTAGKLAVKKFATNTASGFVANSANQLISSGGKSYNFKEAVMSGLAENIDIPGGKAAEKTTKIVGSEIADKASSAFNKKAGVIAAVGAGAPSLKKTLNNSADAGLNKAGVIALPSNQIVDNVPQTTPDFIVGSNGMVVSNDVYNMSNEDFIQEVANIADQKVNVQRLAEGKSTTGHVAGSLKHGEAASIAKDYQKNIADRGLIIEKNYLDGNAIPKVTKGCVRPDVYDSRKNQIYDYKFVVNPGRGLSKRQIDKILKHGPVGLSQSDIHEVNPR